MKLKAALSLVLIVGMLVPAAGATPTHSSTATEPTATPTAASATDGADAVNYTRLYIRDGYRHFEVKPGDSVSFDVTVENGEDHPVTLSPHVFVPELANSPPVSAEWVSIDPGEATLKPGAERTVTINVTVPADTEIARYQGVIALTNETIQRDDRPPRPVHDVNFGLEVYKDPLIHILSRDYIHTQVKAGDTLHRSIVIENRGNQSVPLDPTVETRNRHRMPPGDDDGLQRSWIEIQAPPEIPADGTTTVNVSIDVPESATRGDYDTEIDLGIDDPHRRDRHDYWQQIHVSFQVWTQPEEAFTTPVHVGENISEVTVTLRGDRDRRDAFDEPPRFDVVLVSPDGQAITLERERQTTNGYVNLGDEPREYGESDGPYATHGKHYEYTYRLADPDAGEWTLRVMPHNVMRFGYEIVQNSEDRGA